MLLMKLILRIINYLKHLITHNYDLRPTYTLYPIPYHLFPTTYHLFINKKSALLRADEILGITKFLITVVFKNLAQFFARIKDTSLNRSEWHTEAVSDFFVFITGDVHIEHLTVFCRETR